MTYTSNSSGWRSEIVLIKLSIAGVGHESRVDAAASEFTRYWATNDI